MKKQQIGSRTRSGVRGKAATGLQEQGRVKIGDINLEHSVMHRMILSAMMAFAAVLVCVILTILRLGAFWQYVLLATLLLFAALTLVEVYLLGKEIQEHRKRHEDCP